MADSHRRSPPPPPPSLLRAPFPKGWPVLGHSYGGAGHVLFPISFFGASLRSPSSSGTPPPPCGRGANSFCKTTFVRLVYSQNDQRDALIILMPKSWDPTPPPLCRTADGKRPS